MPVQVLVLVGFGLRHHFGLERCLDSCVVKGVGRGWSFLGYSPPKGLYPYRINYYWQLFQIGFLSHVVLILFLFENPKFQLNEFLRVRQKDANFAISVSHAGSCKHYKILSIAGRAQKLRWKIEGASDRNSFESILQVFSRLSRGRCLGIGGQSP